MSMDCEVLMKYIFNRFNGFIIVILIMIAAGIMMSSFTMNEKLMDYQEITAEEESEGSEESSETTAFA